MKKIYASLLVLLGFFLATPASAQSIKFGITGGLHLSKLSLKGAKGDYEQLLGNLDGDNKAGWFVGPKVYISLPIGLAVDGAVEYSQRRMDAGNLGSDTYRSIEIPINLRYNIGIGKIASVYVATGPQFGFGMNDLEFNYFDTFDNRFDKSNMNTTWNIGAGVKVLGHLEAGIGYNFGIGNIGKMVLPASYVGDQELKMKSNTFQVQVAYIF